MEQMFPELGPQNNNKTFMEQAGWQLVLIAVSFVTGILGTIIVTVWQGKTHIIDFNWIVIVLIIIMFGIVTYSIRKGQRHRARLQADYLQFKQTWESYFHNEQSRWDKWAITFTEEREKEYGE